MLSGGNRLHENMAQTIALRPGNDMALPGLGIAVGRGERRGCENLFQRGGVDRLRQKTANRAPLTRQLNECVAQLRTVRCGLISHGQDFKELC